MGNSYRLDIGRAEGVCRYRDELLAGRLRVRAGPGSLDLQLQQVGLGEAGPVDRTPLSL